MYNQRLAFLLLFVIVSLAGVPPAFGFAAKFYLFLALYQAQSFTLLACVFFVNLISLSYYLRLIRFIFFNHSSSAVSFQEKQLAP